MTTPLTPARRKALVLFASMASAAALAVVRKPSRRLADERPAVKLESVFPATFGGWQLAPAAGGVVRPADETGKIYGIYDQVLERVYIGPQGERVMLSVAYGTEQSVGLQVHRPEVCYPGGGFIVSRLERMNLTVGPRTLPATRLLATQPGRSEPITYWTVLGDKVENNSAAFRWTQITSGLKGDILDGMLVRISTIDMNIERAYEQQARFAAALMAGIDPASQARVFGK